MITKFLKWIPVNILGILGIVQVVIKAIKEILTVIVNMLYPIIPSAKFKKVIDVIRGFVNKLDDFVEKIKEIILKII